MTDTNQEVRETPEAGGLGKDPLGLCKHADALTGRAATFRKMHGNMLMYGEGQAQTDEAIAGALRTASITLDRLFTEGTALASASPPAVPDAVGVRTKALAWKRVSGTEFSSGVETSVGTYRTWTHHEANGEWYWNLASISGGAVLDGSGSSEAEVQSSAQADFDRRILSSIEPTPSPEQEDDTAGMAAIGRSFMASFGTITAMDGPYKGWTPAEDPAELVLDLYHDLIEARSEATPSPELRHFANCVQCGRIVDTREKSAGGDAYGCEVGDDRWVCSLSCYETELGGTPSPEPQASNAGVVQPVAHYQKSNFGHDAIFWLSETIRDAMPDNGPLLASLSTPEPRTGERDGEIKNFAVARVINDNQSGNAAIVTILCDPPTLPVGTLLYQRSLDHAAELVEAFQAGMRFATDDAERRLAEVEERAREDERDRLAALLNDGNSVWCDYAHEWLTSEEDAMLPADRAALRAKPEAQAIVGKGAGE